MPDGRQQSRGQQQARSAPAAPGADWRTAVASQLAPATSQGTTTAGRVVAAPSVDETGDYKLRPVTPVNVPKLAASEWDDAELGPAIDSSVGGIFTTPVAVAPSSAVRPVPTGPSTAFPAYRSFFSLLVRATTWISETSYTVSFILIILAVASGRIGRHSLAAMGCGAIVALNLVGLAGDLASLVTLSFRKNPMQGVLFLIPPFTLYYLWSDWQRYRDTVSRMRIPLTMLAVVVAAYMFVPWLHGGKESTGPINASVKRVADALDEDLESVKGTVNERLKAARTLLREGPVPAPSSQPGSESTNQPTPGQRP